MAGRPAADDDTGRFALAVFVSVVALAL